MVAFHATVNWAISEHPDKGFMAAVSYKEVHTGEPLQRQFLCFPRLRVAVELHHGRRIVWDPSEPHCTTVLPAGKVNAGLLSLGIFQTLKTARCTEKVQNGLAV